MVNVAVQPPDTKPAALSVFSHRYPSFVVLPEALQQERNQLFRKVLSLWRPAPSFFLDNSTLAAVKLITRRPGNQENGREISSAFGLSKCVIRRKSQEPERLFEAWARP